MRDASGVRHELCPGPIPTSITWPVLRPPKLAISAQGASSMATAIVADADFCFSTIRRPFSPDAASAAASATPCAPISLKTTSDGFAKRGVSASRLSTSKTLNGTSRCAASASMAGSSALISTETTAAIAAGLRSCLSRCSRTCGINSSDAHPLAQPTPKTSCCGQ